MSLTRSTALTSRGMTACLPSGSTNGHDYELGWRHQTSQFKHADFPDVNLTGDLMMPNFLKPDTASSWGCDCAPQNPWHRIPKRMPKPSTALCQAGGCCFPTNKPRMLHFQFRCHMAECEIFSNRLTLSQPPGVLRFNFKMLARFWFPAFAVYFTRTWRCAIPSTATVQGASAFRAGGTPVAGGTGSGSPKEDHPPDSGHRSAARRN